MLYNYLKSLSKVFNDKNKIFILQKCALDLMFFDNFYQNGYSTGIDLSLTQLTKENLLKTPLI